MHLATRLTRDLVAIPSVNPMGTGASGPLYSERAVAEYVQAFLRTLGMDSEIWGEDETHPNLTAELQCGSPATVLLEAHMDTVSHENMSIDPFDPVILDGRLYGRGSCDTKASLAAYLYALHQVCTGSRRPSLNVILAAVHDEEYTFGGARELLRRGVAADFAVAGEPTGLDIVYAHKGVCRFFVTTRGAAAHAAVPWLGSNAIHRMSEVLSSLAACADALALRPHPHLGPATLNVGRILGGDTVNTVPSWCRIEVDRRLLPGESFSDVRQGLAELLASRSDVTIEDAYLDVPAVYTDPAATPCRQLLAACRGAGFEPTFATAHYATDASILSTAGMATLVFGPGSVEVAHGARECVPVADIEAASLAITELISS